jgi:hypothetical protein
MKALIDPSKSGIKHRNKWLAGSTNLEHLYKCKYYWSKSINLGTEFTSYSYFKMQNDLRCTGKLG